MYLGSRYLEIPPPARPTRNVAQLGLVAPCKRRDAVRMDWWRNREAADQIAPTFALLLSHDEHSSLPHRALNSDQFGSVSACLEPKYKV